MSEIGARTTKPYRDLVGALLYLATNCRPDISYSTSFLSRFMDRATDTHWAAAQRVLKYLKGTKKHGLLYRKGSHPLLGYSDSDFADDINDRKSTSGFIFLLNGATIYWRLKKQTVVAQSTTEAEYVAISFAVREAIWLKSVMRDLGYNIWSSTNRISIKTDNIQVISLSKDEIFSEKSKHIDDKYHLVRDHSQTGTVILSHIPTDEMIADTMTKALLHVKFSKFRNIIGVLHC